MAINDLLQKSKYLIFKKAEFMNLSEIFKNIQMKNLV